MITATQGLELVAVSSSRASDVQADYPGMDVEKDPFALVARNDLDLVVIASPNDSHRPLAEAALKNGLNVVVDKPFTLTLDDARAIVQTAKQAGKIISVFQNRRWDSDFLAVQKAIADGVVGNVKHFESHIDRFRPVPQNRWRENAGPGAGLWFDLGPHLADQALQLFGLPESVTASLAVLRTGAQTEDWAHVVMQYKGLRVILHGSMIAAGMHTRFTVHGDKGTVVKHGSDQQEARLKSGMTPNAAGFGDDADDLIVFDADGVQSTLPTPSGNQVQYYAEIRDAIHGNAPNPVPPHQALAVMAVLEAAADSARTGTTCALALMDEERALWG